MPWFAGNGMSGMTANHTPNAGLAPHGESSSKPFEGGMGPAVGKVAYSKPHGQPGLLQQLLQRFACQTSCCITEDGHEAVDWPFNDVAVGDFDELRRSPTGTMQVSIFRKNDDGGMPDSDGLVDRPERTISVGVRYSGQWLGRQCHGNGVLCKDDGSRYEGAFVDGRAQGFGKFVALNGNFYEGHWQDNRAHGAGTYVSDEDGVIYEGEWEQDEKSGQGIEQWVDGTRYVGQFLNNMKHGHGTYSSSNGVVFEGAFFNDQMHGEGTYTFADGRKYHGQMKSGHVHGHGVMEWSYGPTYTGDFETDHRHGEGVFTWPDGREYRGQWCNGKRHGFGVTVDTSGKESHGRWKNGVEVNKDSSLRPTNMINCETSLDSISSCTSTSCGSPRESISERGAMCPSPSSTVGSGRFPMTRKGVVLGWSLATDSQLGE